MSSEEKFTIHMCTDVLRFPLNVLSSDTILQVKKRFKALTGVKVNRQFLSLNGVELRDEYTVEFYELTNDNSLKIEVVPIHKTGQIFTVRTKLVANCGTLNRNIDVHDSMTVAQLKYLIHCSTRAPIVGMKLFYRRLEMEDSNSISAYYVTDGSTIEIFLE